MLFQHTDRSCIIVLLRVRPLSTVGYTSVVANVTLVYPTVDSGLTNLIHDRCSVK